MRLPIGEHSRSEKYSIRRQLSTTLHDDEMVISISRGLLPLVLLLYNTLFSGEASSLLFFSRISSVFLSLCNNTTRSNATTGRNLDVSLHNRRRYFNNSTLFNDANCYCGTGFTILPEIALSNALPVITQQRQFTNRYFQARGRIFPKDSNCLYLLIPINKKSHRENRRHRSRSCFFYRTIKPPTRQQYQISINKYRKK